MTLGGAMLVVLGYLFSLDPNQYATGPMIQEATALEVDEINNAVKLLINRGYAFAHVFSNDTWRFTQVKITSDGRLFWEHEKFKIEQTEQEL